MNLDPRPDPLAPPVKTKLYPNIPWRCQYGCFAQPGEGCKSGEGECWPDKVRPPSTFRNGGLALP